MDQRTCAIIVRGRRRGAPERRLAAVSEQTRPLAKIVVVDHSRGDAAKLPSEVGPADSQVLALGSDSGPAGAFHAGMKQAYDEGFDWLWLLRDDIVPEPSALEALLDASTAVPDLPAPYLLASKVVTPNGQLDPENAPFPDTKRVPHAVRSVSGGLVPVRTAGFASVLVSRAAVRDHGLPERAYFDRGYDREYTARLLREGVGFVVPRSVVRREAEIAPATSDATEDLYRDVRNAVFMMRGNAWMGREKVQLAIDLAPRARASGLRSAATIARGLVDGLRRSP